MFHHYPKQARHFNIFFFREFFRQLTSCGLCMVSGFFALFLLLTLSGCASTPTTFAKLGGYHKDATGDLSSAADAIIASEPKALWQTPIDSLEVDQIVALRGQRMLVGMLRLSHSFGEPSYGPYRLVDVRTGGTLWEYSRKPSVRYGYQVISSDPVILVARADRKLQLVTYIALDSKSGRELWSRELSARHDIALFASQGLLVLADATDKGVTLEALKLESGIRRWTVKRNSVMDAPQEPLLITGKDQVVLFGNGAAAYSLRDGRTVWQLSEAGALSLQSNPLELADAIAVVLGERMLTLVGDDGHLLWQQKLPGNSGILGGDETQIIVQLPGNDSVEDKISAYDRTSGRSLWQRNAGGRLHSELLKIGSKLLYTTRDLHGENGKLHFLNAATGKELQTVELATHKGRLPDRLLPYAQHVVVVHEYGPAAFRLSDGKVLWSHSVTPSFDSARADWLLSFFINYYAPKNSQTKYNSVSFASDLDTMNSYRQQIDLKSSALSYRANVYQGTAATLSSSSGASSTARYSARQERIAATEYAIGMTRTHQAMEQRAATQQLYSALVAAGDAMVKGMAQEMEEGPKRAEAGRLPLMQMLSKRMHDNAVQGNYYVRGFRQKGNVRITGFMVADLRDGRWIEVATSPDHEVYGEVGSFAVLGVQLPVLSDDASHLLLKGIGTAKEKWQQIELGNTRAVGASLLGYSVAMDTLHAPEMATQFGGWGYINHQGEYQIPPHYADALPFSEGKARVVEAGENYFINSKGNKVVTPAAAVAAVGQYAEGRAIAWSLPLASPSRRCGYIDTAGKLVVPMIYAQCLGFSNGLAAVNPAENKYWGYIDKNGKSVTKFEFTCAEPHHDGLALIYSGGNSILGGTAFNCQFNKGGHFGYIDTQGRVAITPTLGMAYSFNEGLAFAARPEGKPDDGFGFIDTRGNFVLGPKFARQIPNEAPTRFSDGLFGVSSWEKGMLKSSKSGGYMNRQGKMVIPSNSNFECVFDFKEGFARIRKNTFAGTCLMDKGDWGYIDKAGKYLVEPRFRIAEDFSEGLALVREHGGQYGYIGTSGKFIIDPRFQDAKSFSEGLAPVYVSGRRWFRKMEE